MNKMKLSYSRTEAKRRFMSLNNSLSDSRSLKVIGHGKVKVKERIVLREIHLRTTGRHLSMGSHSVICHPTAFTPTGQVGTRFIDPVRMKG